jgi:lipopolysaccharide export system permease protein
MVMRFLKPFVFGVGVFALLIFLADFFDKMPQLFQSPASLWVILQWLWLDVPYWTVRIIPMATLLATLFAVTGFIRSGEWIAVQASGFEPKIFLRPLLIMAILVTAISFIAQETILPICYSRAQFLWRDQINPKWEWDKYRDVMLVAGPGLFITAQTFLVKEGRMVWPVLDYYREGRIERQIVAKEADWDADASRWIFLNGTERSFRADETVEEEKDFVRSVSDLDSPPKALIPRSKNPDEMSLAETLKYLRQVRMLGGSSREAWTSLYAKIAYPFSNLILCALGIPLALKLRRSSKIVSFGAALALSFIYLWVMEMGRALGVTGRVPALVGAWTANILFGAVAYWAQRHSEI